MHSVYSMSDKGTFTLIKSELTRREANELAKSLRGSGQKIAVFRGNIARSAF